MYLGHKVKQKRQVIERIELSNQEKMRTLEEKYLGILEADIIK